MQVTTPDDIVEVGESVHFRCPVVRDTGVAFRRTFTPTSNVWEYRIGETGNVMSGESTSTYGTLLHAPEINIYLWPTEQVAGGSSVSMTITTQTCIGVLGACLGDWRTLDTSTIGATRGCLTVRPTVSANGINFGTVVWDTSGYPAVTREMTISMIMPSGCTTMGSDWAVQIGTLGLTAPGGAIIPASAIVYAGSSNVPHGMTPLPGGQPLTSGTTIATGSSSVPIGSSISVTLVLSPPSNVPPGNYTTTLVITTVAAGQ